MTDSKPFAVIESLECEHENLESVQFAEQAQLHQTETKEAAQ